MATTAPVLDYKPAIGFGDRLRRLRLDLGLDIREMGKALGMSHATINRHENGHGAGRSARHIAAEVQLAFGSRASIDLREWLLSGRYVSRQPTVLTTPAGRLLHLDAARQRRASRLSVPR